MGFGDLLDTFQSFEKYPRAGARSPGSYQKGQIPLAPQGQGELAEGQEGAA